MTSRTSRHVAVAGDVIATPRRLTVDSYDARKKDIPKYHRSETLTQNVDTLSLRARTVLTPTAQQVCAMLNRCARCALPNHHMFCALLHLDLLLTLLYVHVMLALPSLLLDIAALLTLVCT